ncbi:MAG: 50S ribosomal protein L10 [Patescibacteria group bacterium]|nr:50S ribosomal protein L10 [Patescibacteria group bacterium]
MALTKNKKSEILAKLSDTLAGTASAVFVSFTGLTVHEANELRAGLKKEGVKYAVVKKTLLQRALSEKGYAGEMPELPGEVAFAHLAEGEDITAPARSLQTFVKKFKDKLVFLGGVLENKFLNQSEITNVAQIPALPVLQGMFANVINSPLQRFAIALSEVAKTKNA